MALFSRPSFGLAVRAVHSAAGAKRVCVVGAGPSGFYFTKYLLRDLPDVAVDLLDALPTPFGLVRSGVAPDHPDVKAVQNDFSAVLMDPRVRFWGNVDVGKDVRCLHRAGIERVCL